MEKEIIKSKVCTKTKLLTLAIALVGVITTICIFCDGGIDAWFDYAFSDGLFSLEAFLAWGGLALIIIGVSLFISVQKMTLVVTDRRVYGQAMFGKRVDLPVDLISAVGTSFLNGILVSTSSGKICFLGVENKNEIHTEISKLLMLRQEKAEKTIQQETSGGNADELKKYKELLDSGVITQEEFDAKKKQLLDL